MTTLEALAADGAGVETSDEEHERFLESLGFPPEPAPKAKPKPWPTYDYDAPPDPKSGWAKFH